MRYTWETYLVPGGISPVTKRDSVAVSGHATFAALFSPGALLAFLLCFQADRPQAAMTLSPEAEELAYCTNVLAYGINWFMLNDNEGAAKLMIVHYVRATTAFWMMHYSDGKLPGRYLREFEAVGEQARSHLDENPGRLTAVLDACVAVGNRHAHLQSKRKIRMWGKTWSEIEEQLASETRHRLGLD